MSMYGRYASFLGYPNPNGEVREIVYVAKLVRRVDMAQSKRSLYITSTLSDFDKYPHILQTVYRARA